MQPSHNDLKNMFNGALAWVLDMNILDAVIFHVFTVRCNRESKIIDEST